LRGDGNVIKKYLRVHVIIIIIMSEKSDILDNFLQKYRCDKCNKYYSSNSSLRNHNNKFHKNLTSESSEKI